MCLCNRHWVNPSLLLLFFLSISHRISTYTQASTNNRIQIELLTDAFNQNISKEFHDIKYARVQLKNLIIFRSLIQKQKILSLFVFLTFICILRLTMTKLTLIIATSIIVQVSFPII